MIMSTCPKKTKNLCTVQLMVKEENKLIIQIFLFISIFTPNNFYLSLINYY